MIEIRDLSKQYGNFTALKNISFNIPDKGVLGFLGKNGAGKSTVMNIITGYLSPSAGKILFDGQDIQKIRKEASRRIGYLPEVPPLYVDMTVNDFLRFVCKIKGVHSSKARLHVNEICETTGLQNHQSHLIRTLSKGYRQRVGMAQAMIGDPDIMLLDEPTAGLDPVQILDFEALICELGKRKSIVLSSHILQEISRTCDSMAIIDDGKILSQRSLNEDQENARLYLEVAGTERIDAQLRTIQGITDITLEKTDQKSIAYTLIYQKGQNVRTAIFYTLSQINRPILEIRILRDSVQDLFLQITHSEKEQNA